MHAVQAGATSTAMTFPAKQLQQRTVITASSAVSYLCPATTEDTSFTQLQIPKEPSSRCQQQAVPPAPSCMAQLEDAFHAEYHSTHEPLSKALLRLLYCDLAASAWQHALEEERRRDAAVRGYQEICRRRQEKVRASASPALLLGKCM